MSYGVHTPSYVWTDFINSLKRRFGEDGATYLFWEPSQEVGSVSDIERLINRDVTDANHVQRMLNNGYFGPLNKEEYPDPLAYCITQLRLGSVQGVSR